MESCLNWPVLRFNICTSTSATWAVKLDVEECDAIRDLRHHPTKVAYMLRLCAKVIGESRADISFQCLRIGKVTWLRWACLENHRCLISKFHSIRIGLDDHVFLCWKAGSVFAPYWKGSVAVVVICNQTWSFEERPFPIRGDWTNRRCSHGSTTMEGPRCHI